MSSEELDELRQQAEAALDRGLEAATKVRPHKTPRAFTGWSDGTCARPPGQAGSAPGGWECQGGQHPTGSQP